jgi:hypothetical protein
MKIKEIVTTLLIILIVVVLSILIINKVSANENKPYNKVELTANNYIVNSISNTSYDTVVKVALDIAGISGIQVFIQELSESAKSQFNGELKAHVRYFNGDFYLFISNLDSKEAIEIISHEVVHIQQYLNGDFVYDQDSNETYWKGELYYPDNIPYERRPWEDNAFEMQSSIYDKVYSVLY